MPMSQSLPYLTDLAWICTLSAMEVLRFGTCRWWWQLRWATSQEFRGLDIRQVIEQYRQGDPGELSYGETPTVTLARILELTELPLGSGFVDLGAGRGTTVLAARLMGYRSGGVELIGEYLERAQRVAERLKLDVDLRHGNLLELDWPEGDLYLINSTAFPEGFRESLADRLEQLPPNTFIATYDWALSPERFEEQSALRLPVTRGTVDCRIFRVLPR